MAERPFEFWFEYASTYSYPAQARIEPLAGAAGVAVTWRPFLLGPIFKAQGWADSPFNLYPAKGRYMWRDLERVCAKHGLAFRKPSQFPRNGLLAARVTIIAAEEGWCPDFARAVYRANFVENRDIAQPEVIGAILAALGRDAHSILERAQSADVKERLRQQTERAATAGIFGAPTVQIGTELFWGNDRLEDAVAFHREAAPTPGLC